MATLADVAVPAHAVPDVGDVRLVAHAADGAGAGAAEGEEAPALVDKDRRRRGASRQRLWRLRRLPLQVEGEAGRGDLEGRPGRLGKGKGG